MKTLSNKQKKVLDFISDFIKQEDKSPTVEEIRSGLGFSSSRSVSQYLDALVQKGFISKSRSPRSITLVNYYENIENETVMLPLYGLASCGTPEFYADNNIEDYVAVDKQLVRTDKKSHYLVRASGTSMDKAGIPDSSLVLVEKKDGYQEGEKVVVVVDDKAAIKKIYRGDSAMLFAPVSSEEKHKPIIMRDGYHIAGKVICTIPDPALVNEPRYVEIKDEPTPSEELSKEYRL